MDLHDIFADFEENFNFSATLEGNTLQQIYWKYQPAGKTWFELLPAVKITCQLPANYQ